MNLKKAAPDIAYYLALVFIATGTLFPNLRLWGFSNWAFYPVYTQLAVFLLAAIIPLIIRLLERRKPEFLSGKHFSLILGIAATAPLILLMIFSKGSAHFLGDGDLRIELLPKINPLLRISDFGATVVARLLYGIFESSVAGAAETAYQVLSYAGGLIFLVVVSIFSMRWYDDINRRVLFILSLITSGLVLLFFGYVENYSLFVATAACLVLAGVDVCRGRLSRWLIIPLLLVTAFLHIFGLVFIPAAVYALISNTRLHKWLKKAGLKVTFPALLVVLGVCVIVLYNLYQHIYFLRFAIVPLVENDFTVAGYTLFSDAHIVDFVNLLFLLFPSGVIVLASLAGSFKKTLTGSTEVVFLLTASISCVVAGFLLYPQLGMPRDWDLYAFAGVPLTVFGVYLVISGHRKQMSSRGLPILLIALNLLVLIPRLGAHTNPDIAVEQVKSYARLDPQKYIYVHKLLIEDCVNRDRRDQLPQLDNMLRRLSPEQASLIEGEKLKNQQNFDTAIMQFRNALKHNPMLAPAYYNIGSCFLMTGRFDSARVYLEIANGWNPHNPTILNELGFAHAGQRNYEAAEKYWKKLLLIRGADLTGTLNLLDLYSITRQVEKKKRLLQITEVPSNEPGYLLKQLGDHYLSVGDRANARLVYRNGLIRGLDSLSTEDVYSKFPDLRAAP